MTVAHLWQKAASFAALHHRRHERHDGSTPYFSHPARVALTVSCVFGFDDEPVIAAALLHDTIEDTTVDYDDLHEHFGRRVADIVAALSKDARLPEAQREASYDRQLAEGPWEARLIKLADVYDNLHDAGSDRARRKQLDRVRRALALAESDAPLEAACRIVSEAARRFEALVDSQDEREAHAARRV